MRTEQELKKQIDGLLKELQNAIETNDKETIYKIKQILACFYWVLDETYVLPSQEDKTTNYDKFRKLSPTQMAKFLTIENDGICHVNLCSVCTNYDSCENKIVVLDDKCSAGFENWLQTKTTAKDWRDLLERKGIRIYDWVEI